MSEVKKRKKFYKVDEIIWIKGEKCTAKIISLDIPNYEVSILRSKATEPATLKLWDITKYHKTIATRSTVKPLKIKVKYLTDVDNVFLPLKKVGVGDWIDLRSAEDIRMKTGERGLIPLGVAMKLPEGYEAFIAPRSSTFKNFHILQPNSPGVVDNSYSGNTDQWYMSVYATEDVSINRGERVCQFRLIRSMPTVEFDVVNNLDENARGGFGSTGTK